MASRAGEYAWIIWVTVVPVCLAAGALLLYITFKPLFEKRTAERDAKIPHGTAVKLDVSSKLIYNRIAITIDFSNMDTLTIRSAFAQGGNRAVLLLHVVETAGAMVYGSEIEDQESAKET